jgi:hypothetical protein
LPPSPLGRDNQPTYSPPGRSRNPAMGPPVPGLVLVKVRRAGPTLTLSRRFIYLEVVVFGSAQDESNIRCRRRPPLQMDDDDDHYAPAPALPPSQAAKKMSSSEHGRVRPGTKDCRSRSRSESSGGPTRYTQCWFFLLHRPAARDDAAIKATPSARCYSRVSP